jgi:hypothetical protein
LESGWRRGRHLRVRPGARGKRGQVSQLVEEGLRWRFAGGQELPWKGDQHAKNQFC